MPRQLMYPQPGQAPGPPHPPRPLSLQDSGAFPFPDLLVTIHQGVFMGNDIQRQKTEIASLYSRVASSYGRVGPDVFSPIGSWLVELMQLSPGTQC